MGCEGNRIEVESLDDEDSWVLFKKIIEFHEELSFEVEDIALYVACECEGLPLAIVRIATSMKGKQRARDLAHRLNDMFECLQNLANGQYEMDKWVLPVLRSSYDFLNKKLQAFFLYCAISTNGPFGLEEANRLLRRFVYDSIDETKTLRVQYNECYSMLDKLHNQNMLKADGLRWRINKFLRALAFDIAKSTSAIMPNSYKNLKEIPSGDQWKEDLQKVFLTGNHIRTIPNGSCPRCSQLSTLLLDGNENLDFISNEFFNYLPALKTLDLSRTRIKCLPKSVSNLKCLVALLLSRCNELTYIPSLENLKRLVALDLSFTAIAEAPMGLESLDNLRYLNVLRTDNLKMSSLPISELINLEHLELIFTAPGIQGLDKMEVLVAYFQDINIFNTSMSLLDEYCALESFYLTVSSESYDDDDDDEVVRDYHTRRITFTGMDLGNVKADLPVNTEELFINNCHQVTSARSLCSSVIHYGLQIEQLEIHSCTGVEYLYCFSRSCPFCSSSRLVGGLFLEELEDLKDLVSPYATVSLQESSLFSHLTYLHISSCNNMESVMTPKLLAHFQNLRDIRIVDCKMMKEIVTGEQHSEMEHATITLPKLTSFRLQGMPQLDVVYRGLMLCPSLQIFDAYHGCEQLNPPQIKISSDGCVLPMEKTESGYPLQHKSD